MQKLLNELSNSPKFDSYLKNIKKDVTPIILSGLTDVSKNLFMFATEEILKRPVLVITYNEIQAKNIVKDLKNMWGVVGERDIDKSDIGGNKAGRNNVGEVLYFPKREIMSYDYEAQSKEVYAERIGTLNKMYAGRASIVVTTIEAVSQKMISKEVLFKNVLDLKIGKRYNLEDLKQVLVELGYERFDLIEGKGQFGIRGGIVDIAISSEKGVRVEFFDDEVDSIRYFNIQSQRSTEMIDEIQIYPAYEFVLERTLEEIISDIKLSKIGAIKERQEEDIEEILQGNYINKVDRYFDAFYKKQVTFLDYVSFDTIVFLDEIEKIKARIENIKNDNENVIKLLIEKEKIVPDALKSIGDFNEFYGVGAKMVSVPKNVGVVDGIGGALDDKVIVHLLREELVGDKEALFNRSIFYQNSPSPMERNNESGSIGGIRGTKS